MNYLLQIDVTVAIKTKYNQNSLILRLLLQITKAFQVSSIKGKGLNIGM